MKDFLRKEFFWAVLIFLLGIFLRIYHLDYPLGFHGDEAMTGLDALRILSGKSIGFWADGLGQPNMIVYFTAFLFSFLPPDITTVRLSYSLFWIVSLPFFYGIVRFLFDKQIALIAFFLFVIDRTLIHFSHIGYSPYIPPFLISTFFFLYAIKTKNTWLFLLSGILCGLSLYFYIALFVFPILIFGYLLYLFHKPNEFIKYKKALLLFFLGFIFAFLPYGIFIYQNPSIVSRGDAANIFDKKALNHLRGSEYPTESQSLILLKQIEKTAFMFHIQGDRDPQNNPDYIPLLDKVSGIFFLLGFIFCLINIRKKEYIFLLLWFTTFLLGSILTAGAPHFRRTQPSIAATSVLVALGILWSYRTSVTWFPEFRNASKLLIIISLISIFFSNAYFYFTTQATTNSTKYIFGYQILKTAEFITDIKKAYPNVYVYSFITDVSLGHPTMKFITDRVLGEDRSQSKTLTNSHINPVLYVFAPNYFDSFKKIQSLYPGGKHYLVKDTDGTVLLYAYLLY